MQTIYIWRDAVDPRTINAGIKLYGTYILLFSLASHDQEKIIGTNIVDAVFKLNPGVPLAVTITAKVGE